MTAQDVVYVAVAPKETIAPGLVEKAAAIINKDPFGTRILLNSNIPKILCHRPTLQDAESIADKLRSLGLVTVLCANSQLRLVSSSRLRAHTMKLGEGEATFMNKVGQERTIKAGNLFLILKGTRQIRTEKETTTVKRTLNVAATALTGGIPVMKKVEGKSRAESTTTDDFLRLYDRESLEPIVEVLQLDFDYSSLGKKKAFSSLENINIMAAELRNMFPGAIFDGRLARQFTADVPFATPEDQFEINCKLIYLCHRAESGAEPLS